MSEPAVVGIPNGRFAQNCWLVADPGAGEAAVVDPGEEAGRILAELAGRGWRATAIWLTHAHIDHVLGVAAVREATGAPVHLHPLDRPLYDNVAEQGRWFGIEVPPLPPPDREFAEGDQVRVGALEFTVHHLPGHSPGHVALVGHGHCFSGDVLFRGSVGRVDLPGGDGAALLASIRRRLLTLPGDVVVHSGHGPDTTIGEERRGNPFLTGAGLLA
ncbi:MAG TPA: MBL fold metallo-hydrolase [Gemmatimonadales bacterium]|nr:MBL fold metallo-hydrolase [Gemmatimonadales bacterium]